MNRKFIAVLLSALVIPGAGQFYTKNYLKGALLAAASLGVVAAFIMKTWSAAYDAALSMPPGDAVANAARIAASIAETNRGFYNGAVAVFAIVWAIGVIDAYIFGGQGSGTGKI